MIVRLVAERVGPLQDDLAGVARARDGEGLLVLGDGEVMRDDGRDVEAALTIAVILYQVSNISRP